jgi:hypothetical protein
MYVCMYVCMCVGMYLYMYVCTCVCVYVRIHVGMYYVCMFDLLAPEHLGGFCPLSELKKVSLIVCVR